MTVIDRVTSPAERYSHKAESRRHNRLCALGIPALTGGICGLPRGCCPRARNGAGRVFQMLGTCCLLVRRHVVALTLNIRNNTWGYWINLGVLTPKRT